MSNNPYGEISFKILGLKETGQDFQSATVDLKNFTVGVKEAQQAMEKPVDFKLPTAANAGIVDQFTKELDRRYSGQSSTGRSSGEGQSSSNDARLGDALQGSEQLTQNFAQLAAALPNASEEVQAFTQNLTIASDATATASAVMQEMGKATVLTGGAVLLAVGAMTALNSVTSKSRKEQEEYIRELEDVANRELRIRELSISASKEYIAVETRRIEFEKQVLEARAEGLRAQIRNQSSELEESVGGFFAEAAQGARELYGIDLTGTKKFREDLADLDNQLAGLNAELEILNSEELRRVAAVNETIAVIQSEADLRVQLARQLDSLTTEQINQIVRVNEEIAKIRQNELVEYLGELARVAGDYGPAIEGMQKGLQAGVLTANDIKQSIDQYLNNSDVYQLTPEFERLAGEINATAIELVGLTKETKFYQTEGMKAAEANEAQTRTTEALRKAHEELSQTLQTSLDELEQVNSSIEEIQQTLADERAQQNTEDLRNYITETLEAQIEAAKQREQQAELERKAAEVRTTALEREVEITTQLRNEQAAALAQLNAQISQLNADYMASELKAVEEFRKQESRINEDYNRDRLRTIEDLNDNLLEAALDNDVKRFIQIQKEGEKQLRRQAEDAGVEARRRAEDFLQERQQAQQQFAQRLAELQAQYQAESEQRKEAAAQQLLELKENLNEQLKQLQQSGQRQISESYALEQRLQLLRSTWAQQDEQARRQIRLQGLQQELQDMIAHQAALRNVISSSFSQIMGDLLGLGGGSSSSSGSTSGSTSGVPTLPAPPRLPTAGSGGFKGRVGDSTINVNVESPIVGDVASTKDVIEGVTQGVSLIAERILRVAAGVR